MNPTEKGRARGYIYALTDEHGQPQYVGSTWLLFLRYREHLGSGAGQSRKLKWICACMERGHVPKCILLETGVWTPKQLDDREHYWIKKLIKEGKCLTNHEGATKRSRLMKLPNPTLAGQFIDEMKFWKGVLQSKGLKKSSKTGPTKR